VVLFLFILAMRSKVKPPLAYFINKKSFLQHFLIYALFVLRKISGNSSFYKIEPCYLATIKTSWFLPPVISNNCKLPFPLLYIIFSKNFFQQKSLLAFLERYFIILSLT